MLELDHVVIAAADLEAAAIVLEERYGLHSVEGAAIPTAVTRGYSRAPLPVSGASQRLLTDQLYGRFRALFGTRRWVSRPTAMSGAKPQSGGGAGGGG